jgi:hypothetical protein
VALRFYLNGQRVETEVTGIRGRVFPVFYVDDGAILDVAFRDFASPPPHGFDFIMVEHSII